MDIGRTEITFVEPTGYNALLTPLGYGSTIGVWSTDVVLMYPSGVSNALYPVGSTNVISVRPMSILR
jgi:hypothetical protein